MKPDRSNYEIWLIDYLDGNLDDQAIAGLFEFLEENPDLKEEFDELSGYSLVPPDIAFNQKSTLKKTCKDLTDDQFDYLCVAVSENDLTDEQEKELHDIITRDSSKAGRYSVISRLRLKPPNLQYKYKYRLRKLTIAGKAIRYSAIGLSAAASVLIIFTLMRHNPVETPGIQVTELISDTARQVVNHPEVIRPVGQDENAGVNTEKADINIAVDNFPAGHEKVINSDTLSREPLVTQSASDTGYWQQAPRVEIDKVSYLSGVDISTGISGAGLIAINTEDINYPVFDEAPGINDRFARFFREKILHSENPTYGELKAYEIADAGINGLNKLLGWNMSLEENKDDNGDIASIHFSSRLVKFNAPVKNNEDAR